MSNGNKDGDKNKLGFDIQIRVARKSKKGILGHTSLAFGR